MAKAKKQFNSSQHAGTGATYGLGFVGALIYFWQQSDTFWLVLLGLGKAIVWPAYFVYKFFELVY